MNPVVFSVIPPPPEIPPDDVALPVPVTERPPAGLTLPLRFNVPEVTVMPPVVATELVKLALPRPLARMLAWLIVPVIEAVPPNVNVRLPAPLMLFANDSG